MASNRQPYKGSQSSQYSLCMRIICNIFYNETVGEYLIFLMKVYDLRIKRSRSYNFESLIFKVVFFINDKREKLA